MKKNIETKKKKKKKTGSMLYGMYCRMHVFSFILSFSSCLYACCLSNEINAYHPTATTI